MRSTSGAVAVGVGVDTGNECVAVLDGGALVAEFVEFV